MAYPMKPSTLSIKQSVDSIAQSEASILQGMNQIFCLQIINPLLHNSELSVEEKFKIISTTLHGMAAKENSIANVIDSLADMMIANGNINK